MMRLQLQTGAPLPCDQYQAAASPPMLLSVNGKDKTVFNSEKDEKQHVLQHSEHTPAACNHSCARTTSSQYYCERAPTGHQRERLPKQHREIDLKQDVVASSSKKGLPAQPYFPQHGLKRGNHCGQTHCPWHTSDLYRVSCMEQEQGRRGGCCFRVH